MEGILKREKQEYKLNPSNIRELVSGQLAD
jgi:hypothetical protein